MKTYITPTIRVRAVMTDHLLAGSENYLPYNQNSATDESLSKIHEVWDN